MSRASTSSWQRALLALAAWSLGCEAAPVDPREREIASVLAAADAPLLRSRPAMMAGKYRRMSESPFSFFRGSFALYLHDWQLGQVADGTSRFAADAYPFSIGDAHPENFGALPGADVSFRIEPNDFDAADRYLYLLEVRRLAIGIVLASHESNPDDEAQRAEAIDGAAASAHAVALGYADEILLSQTEASDADASDDGEGEVIADVLSRSERDLRERPELDERTVLAKGGRRLVRGAFDPEDPAHRYLDIPIEVAAALPGAIASYRESLAAPPPADFFAIKDVVRELGSGISSYARVRLVILVEGPTASADDDVLLELKELADAYAPLAEPVVVEGDLASRNAEARALAWSRPDADPLWGTSELLGLSVQLRGDFDGYKTVRIKRLAEERGTPEAIAGLGRALGSRLARIHRASEALAPGTVGEIRAALGDDVETFAREQEVVAIAYAAQVIEDHRRFVDALESFGPTLGVAPEPGDGAGLLGGLYEVPAP